MPKVEFVTHASQKILVVDCDGSQDPAASIAAFDRAEILILASPLKSIRLLTVVTDAHFNRALTDRLKSLSDRISPHIHASAAVGVTGLKEIVARGLMMATGRKIQLFETPDQALDWLARQ
jgi:hypothetical protein